MSVFDEAKTVGKLTSMVFQRFWSPDFDVAIRGGGRHRGMPGGVCMVTPPLPGGDNKYLDSQVDKNGS